ncbi:hypothetical protein [Compostimonas suwonensis]|uniref:Uncharacterized protein n=1 Tax=Compostimonas suwonensis TaxID=1048394 RepID=A0A2M9BZJ5_9MICO|nr:hypothetical protein [Compostimonas suwonensis]PJJ63507.1 hypothetical protein CLV54_1175 [Compostimonas suwonensis]
MSTSFSLVDSLALGDLQVYLSRAGRIEDGSVRLIAGSGVLAAYSAVLYPRGLLDSTPTVLGLRTFALAQSADFDAVVPMRSLFDRLARLEASVQTVSAQTTPAPDAATRDAAAAGSGPVVVQLPHEVSTVTWAGISPPKGGWHPVGEIASSVLDSVARESIDEVAAAVPTGTGEQLVQRVRAEVWGRPIPGFEYVPAGAAFSHLSLGFLSPDEPVKLYETGPWTRLTTVRGHTLVRRKAWTLRP